MEEIDLLSSRIAIIHGGRLQAVGPQQRLKAAFGDGYKLTCTMDTAREPPAAAAARLDAFVRRYIAPTAVLTQRTDRAVGYLLPPGDIAYAFSLLLQHRTDAGISEFGISQVS